MEYDGLISTYGDCMCFSELVDCCIEDGDDKDERPVGEVYEKPGRAPDWTRKLDTSRAQRGKEVSRVEPECQVKGGGVQRLWGAPEKLLLAHAPEK